MFFWTCLEYLCCLAATLGLPGHAISCLNDTVNGHSRITRRSQGWFFVLAWTVNISIEMRLLPGSYRCNTRVAQIALHAICLLRHLVAVVLVVVVVVFLYRVYIPQLVAHYVSSRRINIYVSHYRFLPVTLLKRSTATSGNRFLICRFSWHRGDTNK